jgi:formylglycine-generating enzyme required for sulfatase activity
MLPAVRRKPGLALLVAVLVIALPLAALLPVPAQDATAGRKVAFLVGINRYLKPGFRNLDYAEGDVDAVAEELKKLGFEVTVLKGSGKESATATAENIERTVQRLVAPLGKDDLMLVMLSGHGQQLLVKKENGETKEEAFYSPVDAVAGKPESQFSLSHLLDDILSKNVGRKMLLVDACRDVPKDPSRGSRGIQGRVIALPEDTAVLFSCRSGQQSFENETLKHGLFSYCVVEGLRGEAAKNGTVDWDSLVAHVNFRMASEELRKLMPQTMAQLPIPAGGVGYTVLGRIDASKTMLGTHAGQTRDDNGLKTKLVWCPPGEFTMGSPKNEEDRSFDENEVQVSLTKGFWLGQHEVTQSEWQRVMQTTPWSGKEYVKEGDEYPATYVSWNDATQFCGKLTEQERSAGRIPEGWTYSVPTESQWEYACRAGTKTRFSFGDSESDLGDYSWFIKNALDVGEHAHKVSQKKSNRFGLYDMHGNVSEWCRDWYAQELPRGADPPGPSTGSYRVYRGGDYTCTAKFCRSADRNFNSPGYREHLIGFRLAAVPSGK